MTNPLTLIQRIQNKIHFRGWQPYYDNVEYKLSEEHLFELSVKLKEGRVIYQNRCRFEYENPQLGALIDLNVFGGIPSTDIDLESITVEDHGFNQITEFYFDNEKKVFIHNIRKTKGFSAWPLIIEQENKIIFPDNDDEGINKINQIILDQGKRWCSKEYKRMRVDIYKAFYSRTMRLPHEQQ